MPFHHLLTNMLRGGIYFSISWLSLSSVIVATFDSLDVLSEDTMQTMCGSPRPNLSLDSNSALPGTQAFSALTRLFVSAHLVLSHCHCWVCRQWLLVGCTLLMFPVGILLVWRRRCSIDFSIDRNHPPRERNLTLDSKLAVIPLSSPHG